MSSSRRPDVQLRYKRSKGSAKGDHQRAISKMSTHTFSRRRHGTSGRRNDYRRGSSSRSFSSGSFGNRRFFSNDDFFFERRVIAPGPLEVVYGPEWDGVKVGVPQVVFSNGDYVVQLPAITPPVVPETGKATVSNLVSPLGGCAITLTTTIAPVVGLLITLSNLDNVFVTPSVTVALGTPRPVPDVPRTEPTPGVVTTPPKVFSA